MTLRLSTGNKSIEFQKHAMNNGTNQACRNVTPTRSSSFMGENAQFRLHVVRMVEQESDCPRMHVLRCYLVSVLEGDLSQ